MSRAQLTADTAKAFALAGNATLTLESLKTGAHFTYKVSKKEGADFFFVSVLSGPDNTSDYSYIGCLPAGRRFVPKKGRTPPPSAKGFDFFWRALTTGRVPSTLAVWHEGRCGRCSRKLTVPESIESGIGPVCAGR